MAISSCLRGTGPVPRALCWHLGGMITFNLRNKPAAGAQEKRGLDPGTQPTGGGRDQSPGPVWLSRPQTSELCWDRQQAEHGVPPLGLIFASPSSGSSCDLVQSLSHSGHLRFSDLRPCPKTCYSPHWVPSDLSLFTPERGAQSKCDSDNQAAWEEGDWVSPTPYAVKISCF